MADGNNSRILFIINPGSGQNATNWPVVITEFFKSLNYTIELFYLPADCDVKTMKAKIAQFLPNQVVAVGGDGTVKLVAECLIQKDIPLGILPAGSANGLAKELDISERPAEALNIIISGSLKKIHITRINNHLCIHLSDIGFNAYVIKTFESQDGRGMWGYIKASLKVLFKNPQMEVALQIDKKDIKIYAAMIVIANATKYGSGAVINPVGKIDDDLFEVIAVKQISLYEIFKMTVSHQSYNPGKTEIFQTNALTIRSVRRVHFQVDGEYLGKVNEIKAVLVPQALDIIVPSDQSGTAFKKIE